jgi:diadenosine tetraphosphate (Ap4A) HIT family hydrolase
MVHGHFGDTFVVTECTICIDNAAADQGADPWFVARLQTGYVRLSPNQYFRGSSFFVSRKCVREVFDLARVVRARHLNEMAEVATAVNDSFRPRKLNVESLGNGVPHLHWWITPRYETDPRPRAPIWEDLDFLRTQWTEGVRLSPEELVAEKARLLDALKSRDVVIDL